MLERAQTAVLELLYWLYYQFRTFHVYIINMPKFYRFANYIYTTTNIRETVSIDI